jgi:transposase
MGRGRPSKYKPEFCEALEKHMAEGLSFETFAATIGVCEDTLHEWNRVHEDFSESKRRGLNSCKLYWEKLGRDKILSTSWKGGSESLNAAVYRLNMANRFGWRDRVEHSGAVDTSGAKKKIKEMLLNPELAEAARKIAEALDDNEHQDE